MKRSKQTAKPELAWAVNPRMKEALEHHHAGRLPEAESLYRAVLSSEPGHADAHHNLGVVAMQTNRPVEALPHLKAALEARPTQGQYWLSYIAALMQLGQAGVARQVLADGRQRGLAGPQVDALAARLNTADASTTTLSTEEIQQAMVLFNQGRYAELEPVASTLTLRFPQHGFGWQLLTVVLTQLGRFPEALVPAQRSVALLPHDAETHHNLGLVLRGLGRWPDAEASFRRALELKPELAEAHCNLGDALRDPGRLFEAEQSYRRAVELKPDFAEAHQSLSSARAYLSDYREVVRGSDEALRLAPESEPIWEQRLYTFSYHPDLSAEAIYGEFVRWGDRYPAPEVDFSGHDRTPSRRLRIGYVSPDFRRHTSRFFFWPLFANHDPAAVELYAYANVKHEDESTERFKGVFDHWRDIRAQSDSEVAQTIRADRIDILVDCCNHMEDHRLGVFVLKPAPVQATWLGAAWTTGLKMVDYVLFDPYLAPEETLAREAILRLPDFFVAYTPPDETGEVLAPPCLKNGYPTFGYSGRTERLNHHTFRVWGEILRRIPEARLILDFKPFADPPTQAHYRQFMTEHGVDVSRVVMRRSANIFEGLNDVDILLDCFPHSGGTMLFDALWMGVPALTLASRPPVGRIGTSLLTNLGLPDWVAGSEADYIAKACAFAADPDTLAQLRAGMRERMRNSPVMDGPGFARGMEAAYRQMWNHWVSPSAA